MKQTFQILSILGLLILSATLDIVYQNAKKFDPISLQPPIQKLFWLQILSTTLTAILLLLISWYLLRQSPNGSVVTIACIFIGAATLLLVTIPGIRFIAQTGLSKSILSVWLTNIVSSGLSLTNISAAIIFWIGIIRLLPDKYLKKI